MPKANSDDIQATLGLTAAGDRRVWRGRWLIIGAVLLLGAVAVWAWPGSHADGAPRYQAAAAERKTLTVTVTATGSSMPSRRSTSARRSRGSSNRSPWTSTARCGWARCWRV